LKDLSSVRSPDARRERIVPQEQMESRRSAMASPESSASATSAAGLKRPGFQHIDAYGMTHQGKKRHDNQDHFLLGSLSRQMIVDLTSLPPEAQILASPERIASVAMVADGVGSGGGGEEASRRAVAAIAQYIAQSSRAFYAADVDDPDGFTQVLSDAALRCHANLLELAEHDEDHRRYATTFTLFLGLWPQAYLLQLGDSRCYLYREGQLTQITRDQTLAQGLVDQGVLSRANASRSPLSHVLSSAIGGQQAAPVVTRITREWGTVVLLCSDGLTKHVSDERITARLRELTSAEETCKLLVQDALDDGGTDNITIIIGRTVKP
jgi:PPM family protein phosphatase